MSDTLLLTDDLPDTDVPAKFRDAETGALRADALLKSYRELERRLAQRDRAPAPDVAADELARFRDRRGIPATPDAYEIRAPHELCASCPEVNARLHDAHFTPDQAQLVYDLAAERLLPLLAESAAEFEAQRQREKLIAHYGDETRYRALSRQLQAWGSANLPPTVLAALAGTAEGVMALEHMMQKAEPSLPREHVEPRGENEAELRAMMRDPRYWRAREPEFVRRVTEGFRKLVNG